MKKARLLVSIYYFQVLQEHTHERSDDDEEYLDADGNFFETQRFIYFCYVLNALMKQKTFF